MCWCQWKLPSFGVSVKYDYIHMWNHSNVFSMQPFFQMLRNSLLHLQYHTCGGVLKCGHILSLFYWFLLLANVPWNMLKIFCLSAWCISRCNLYILVDKIPLLLKIRVYIKGIFGCFLLCWKLWNLFAYLCFWIV
jgi:hypothetical protein